MKLKSSCCNKFEKKAKACRRCPVMAVLPKKVRRKKLARLRKRLAAAA